MASHRPKLASQRLNLAAGGPDLLPGHLDESVQHLPGALDNEDVVVVVVIVVAAMTASRELRVFDRYSSRQPPGTSPWPQIDTRSNFRPLLVQGPTNEAAASTHGIAATCRIPRAQGVTAPQWVAATHQSGRLGPLGLEPLCSRSRAYLWPICGLRGLSNSPSFGRIRPGFDRHQWMSAVCRPSVAKLGPNLVVRGPNMVETCRSRC